MNNSFIYGTGRLEPNPYYEFLTDSDYIDAMNELDYKKYGITEEQYKQYKEVEYKKKLKKKEKQLILRVFFTVILDSQYGKITSSCEGVFNKEFFREDFKIMNENSSNSSKKKNYSSFTKQTIVNKSKSVKTSISFVRKAEQMFDNYLPTILKSKGNYASIYNQKSYIGDFTGDGINDVIIWFVYGFGGTSIGGIEAAFYENKNEQPVVVAGFEPDYRFNIDKIVNGIVYCTKKLYDKDDSQCCPSIKIPIELYYDKKTITVIEKSHSIK